MRISDWSSDVCSSDLLSRWREAGIETYNNPGWVPPTLALGLWTLDRREEAVQWYAAAVRTEPMHWRDPANLPALLPDWREEDRAKLAEVAAAWAKAPPSWRSEEHTSELQSLMRISYAVFCLKKKNKHNSEK